MKSILALLLVLIPQLVVAQTDVSGNQYGTWTAVGSPYRITGTVTVPIDRTLTIEPGVEVNFQGHYQLKVNGYLHAVGAENDTIHFTTDNPTTGWGGIRIESGDIAQLSYCRIEFGKSAGVYPDMHGGGLALLASDAVVTHCVFADNTADIGDNGMGGAVYGISTGGGATPLTVFSDCRFIRNHCYGEGGAIKFTGDMDSEIINCEFFQNNCNYGGGAFSGYGILGTKLIDCLFVDNYTMYSSGGAVHTLGFSNLMYLVDCTFTENSAVTGDGGAINFAYTQAYVVNTIVYDNPGMYSDDLHLDWGSAADIYYSNLPVPLDATGSFNINVDPQFVDPANYDFRLAGNSQSINTGTDFIILNGETLVDLTSDEYCGNAPDMGPYETCATSAVTDRALSLFEVDQSYPNPFSIRTAIKYRLGAEVFVSARVFDVRGREVRNLLGARQAAGPYSVIWDGMNNTGQPASEGLYFLQMQAGKETSSVRMLLMK